MKKRMKKVVSFLLAAVMAFGSLSGVSYAATGTRPADGTTKEQPFAPGTGESNRFRIPCFVTLDDGTLVAGCDARWNTIMDGGGLDTIVSHSKDNGKTWNYTFANYLGDNGNVANYSSTAFIDPAMATDGKTVYLVADLYSAGVALNGANYAPQTGHTGYNAEHELVLAKSGEKTVTYVVKGETRTELATSSVHTLARMQADFDYHLEKIAGADDHADAYYQLKDNEGNPVDGYTIDAFFNIKGDGVDTNLFCGDSPYFPYPTDFLYMTKSTDGGATWSIPTLLDVKKESEQSLLVGPGRGIVTSTGRIVFTAYEFTSGDKNSVCIYSDDNGVTWERGASVSDWSSEAVVTEANGKLYMFTRHGGYYVSDDFGKTWSPKKEMGITYNLNCQLSAITYSEKIDGKTAIVFSAPSSTGSRSAGKLFTGLVQEDGTIKWAYEYSVNGNADYAYSCLDECLDGSIGLLYESAGAEITYTNIAIEDIAKGAEIGEMWLTDAEGNATTFALMKPETTAAFTVNGLEDGAAVTVESSDENVVTASYADGVITVTTKAVNGLKEAKIIVKSGEETAVLNIQVTDSENFEKVTLAMGETKVFTDETGNYADTDLNGVDTAVATVNLEGEDYEAGRLKAKGQLATAQAKFDGEVVNIEDCLYTFTAADGANKYTVSATAADGTTVYLAHKNGANVPNKTESAVIATTYDAAKGFTLQDTTAGNNGSYLFFWRDNTGKLHFDRNSTIDATRCYFELYKASASAPADSPIKGYEKVTAITAGEKYLIAVPAKDDNYYVLRPFNGGSNFNHVAKVTAVMEAAPTEAQYATAVANFNGDIVNVEDCLYTFTAANGNNNYTISGTDVNGTTVYLSHRASNSAGIPNTTTSSVITAEYDSARDAFAMKDNATSGGGQYLYFHGSNTSKLHFDRQGGKDNNCYFELYKASASAPADSPIKGYEKVSAVTAGEKYLIAAPGVDDNYYVLRPFSGGKNFNHVAKVVKPEVPTNGKTTITIKGVSEGETSVKIGDITYFIVVKNKVKNVTLKVGETFIAPGEFMHIDDEYSDLIGIRKNEDQPPYVASAKEKVFEGGKYLIGIGNYVMVSRDGSYAGTSLSGRGMDLVNLKTDELTDKMWTVTKVEGGYTIQDVEGKYLTFNGQNVVLNDDPQTLQIATKAESGFGVSYGNQYLNNYGSANTFVAGYPEDVNAWKWNFFAPVEGYVITAERAGKIDVIIGGVTYRITVEAETPELKTYTAYVDGEFYATGEYNDRVELHAEATQGDKNFVCWMASSAADGEKRVVSVNADYTFYLAHDIWLEAVYEDVEINPEATLVNTIAIPAKDGKVNARFVGQLTVPKGAEIERAGLVWCTKNTPEVLELGAEGTKVTNVKSVNSAYQFSVTINGMPQGKFVRGVIFAEIVNADGTTTYTADNIYYSSEGTITN